MSRPPRGRGRLVDTLRDNPGSTSRELQVLANLSPRQVIVLLRSLRLDGFAYGVLVTGQRWRYYMREEGMSGFRKLVERLSADEGLLDNLEGGQAVRLREWAIVEGMEQIRRGRDPERVLSVICTSIGRVADALSTLDLPTS